jgi:hypothetical protein
MPVLGHNLSTDPKITCVCNIGVAFAKYVKDELVNKKGLKYSFDPGALGNQTTPGQHLHHRQLRVFLQPQRHLSCHLVYLHSEFFLEYV